MRSRNCFGKSQDTLCYTYHDIAVTPRYTAFFLKKHYGNLEVNWAKVKSCCLGMGNILLELVVLLLVLKDSSDTWENCEPGRTRTAFPVM